MALDVDQIRRLSPFDSLMPEHLSQVLPLLRESRHAPHQTFFRRGDDDPWAIYLIAGRVELRSDDDSPPLVIQAGSDAARRPLARLKPRRYTATALEPVRLAFIDEARLDRIVTLDQTAAYEVTEFQGDDPEWMLTLLGHPAFAKIPSAKFAELFARLETRTVVAGQIILTQGEAGEDYYLIRKGQARVLRARDGEAPSEVARLGVGEGFGEEALLTGDPRNATVAMASDGLLTRLGRADFLRILGEPLVRWVSADEAAPLLAAGAVLLDVRLADEFADGSPPGAINLPLSRLRQGAARLDPARKYIVLCQTGRRSCAAAFLLSQRGFDVRVLRDGMKGLTPIPSRQ